MHASIVDNALTPVKPLAGVAQLPDAELEERLKRLSGIERKALALLLAHLGEFDQRRLHAERGQPSLFSYCLHVLGYSEQAAYKRIQAARAARSHPEILRGLADGDLTLTAVVILAPHLHADNALELLAATRGKRTREVEALAAELAPRADSLDCLRALPSQSVPLDPPEAERPASAKEIPAAAIGDPVGNGAASRRRESIEPLSAQRHLFRFTGSSALRTKYERARALSAAAGGSMEAVFEAGLDLLLDKRDPERRMARRKTTTSRLCGGEGNAEGGADLESRPRSYSRRIPTGLRDAVWERDGGRCTFIGPDGGRCPATSRLEIDHVKPYAFGGASDDAANLRVMCRTHNQLLARRIFGTQGDPQFRRGERTILEDSPHGGPPSNEA